MPRKAPEEKFDRLRGRHRKRASQEVRDWDRRAQVPPRPSYMDAETHSKLAALKRELDPLL